MTALSDALSPAPPAPPAAEPIRTSITHPLRIDEVVVPARLTDAGSAGVGRIGLCICPGKCGRSIMGNPWRRDLALDLEVVRRWQPDAVLTLLEAHEFEMLHVNALGPRLNALGIAWHHLPIVDMQPPDERFETAWRDHGPGLRAALRRGGRVLVHCRGGLGRSGLVAARMLVELALPPPLAVAAVRAARPGAIETEAQMRHVLNLAG